MLTRSSASRKWRSRLDPHNSLIQFLLLAASDSALQIRWRALDQAYANARNIAVRYERA